MTTTDAAAARRHHSKRVALAVLMALTGMGLAGCETSSSLFGSASETTQVAEPVAPRPAEVQPALAKVAVAPIIGAPDATGKQIRDEFASAVERQRVTVAQGKDDRVDYTLRGYIVAAKDKGGTKVSYIWDVTDSTGKRVNRVTGEEVVPGHASKDPWAAISPSVAQSVASKAATSFVSWLGTQGGSGQGAMATNSTAVQPAGVGAGDPTRNQRSVTRAGPTTQSVATGSIARDEGVTALVPQVTGAPGDGSKSLAAAIQRELSQKGIALADRPTTGAYRVEGTVVLGEAQSGKQAISIEWLVRDPSGKKVGTVSQKNEIAEGSLDGQWGKVADQAAGAAVQGIVKLLPQGDKAIN